MREKVSIDVFKSVFINKTTWTFLWKQTEQVTTRCRQVKSRDTNTNINMCHCGQTEWSRDVDKR